MKKSFLCLIAVFLILVGLTTIAGAAVSAQVDNGGMNFGPGDTLKISIGVGNSGGTTAVDAYLALILPDTTPIFFEFSGVGLTVSAATYDPATWKKLLSNISLPSGLNTGLIPIFNYGLTGAEPSGTYQTAFLLTTAGTLDVVAVAIAPFFVGTHPVSGILGTYSGLWSNQTYSTSGPISFVIADSQPGFLTMTTTLGGGVFGGTAPAPFAVTADLRTPGSIILSGGSGAFGTITGTLGSDGAFQATLSSIPLAGISSATASGTLLNGSFNVNYTINFLGGYPATGTVSAHR
jgi:hypothetical protein